MKTNTLLEKARLIYEDWLKRKNWSSDYSGPHTTPEEDAMAEVLLALIHRVKKQ